MKIVQAAAAAQAPGQEARGATTNPPPHRTHACIPARVRSVHLTGIRGRHGVRGAGGKVDSRRAQLELRVISRTDAELIESTHDKPQHTASCLQPRTKGGMAPAAAAHCRGRHSGGAAGSRHCIRFFALSPNSICESRLPGRSDAVSLYRAVQPVECVAKCKQWNSRTGAQSVLGQVSL